MEWISVDDRMQEKECKKDIDILIREILYASPSELDLSDETPLALDCNTLQWLTAKDLHEREMGERKAYTQKNR